MLRSVALIAICACGLVAAKAPERPVEVVTTDQAEFSGGTIHVNNAYGQMNVEAWDEPRVEVTVTRTAFRHDTAEERKEGTEYLNRIKVTVQKSGNDVTISTQFPGRNRFLRLVHGLGDFNLDYRIKVPRNAKLDIHHDVGDVTVDGVAGDIDATVKSGDIVVMVPDAEKYAIDARCRIGTIYTDFDGKNKSNYLLGQKFSGGNGHTMHLRAGVGGITVQRIPAVQPAS